MTVTSKILVIAHQSYHLSLTLPWLHNDLATCKKNTEAK